jgi:hypothetical protein
MTGNNIDNIDMEQPLKFMKEEDKEDKNITKEVEQKKDPLFTAKCPQKIIDQLKVIAEKKYRTNSMAHAFRLMVEDEYNSLAGQGVITNE